jgi:hypothetical protein
MVVGFNHNFRYQGEVYHIQTEDSGKLSPNIVTLLYQGGTILASKKTSYADIAKIDNLEQVVEELMKEQHKKMLLALKSGEFDKVIERFKGGRKNASQAAPGAPVAPAAPARSPDAAARTIAPHPAPAPPRQIDAPAAPAQASGTVGHAPPPPGQKKGPAPAIEVSLDDEILSYLIGDGESRKRQDS